MKFCRTAATGDKAVVAFVTWRVIKVNFELYATSTRVECIGNNYYSIVLTCFYHLIRYITLCIISFKSNNSPIPYYTIVPPTMLLFDSSLPNNDNLNSKITGLHFVCSTQKMSAQVLRNINNSPIAVQLMVFAT